MDITSRYRTKYPPKEHEEAVRMLLENIAAKQDDNVKVGIAKSNNRYNDYDRRSLISNESGSSHEQASRNNSSKFKDSTQSKMHQRSNKATSTSDSISTTTSSSIEHENSFREPIPSRTIAVQCDLKSSSLKRDHLFDTSMQASSISSTRYGFYNFSPETLAQRRKLERSISSRDVTRSTPNGSSRQLAANQLGSQIEAPTSMSELSSSLSASDYELNGVRDRGFDKAQNWPPSELRDPSSAGSRRFQNFNNNVDYYRDNGNKGPQYLSTVNNSTSKTRVSTLPRRPVTALSYVSTTRLRGQQQPVSGDCSSDHESELPPTPSAIHGRAMSQQTLNRPRTPALGSQLNGTSSSSSELSADLAPANHRSGLDQQSSNFQGDRSTDEILLTKRGHETVPTKPPRPTLISSAHNEQVRDYRTLGPNGAVMRPQNGSYSETGEKHLDSAASDWLDRDANHAEAGRRVPTLGSKMVHEPAAGLARKPSRVLQDANRVYDENYNSCEEPPTKYWTKPVVNRQAKDAAIGKQYLVSEDELKQSSRGNGKLNSSMSLSRGRSQASAQPFVSATTGGYYTSARKPTKLSLNDRACSQTLLADSQRYAPNIEMGRQQQLAPPNSSNEVCRSTSMRQIGRPSERYESHLYPPNARLQDVNQNGYDQNGQFFSENKDSELLEARTWANPSSTKLLDAQMNGSTAASKPVRRCSRSRSMRNVYGSTDNDQATGTRREFYPAQTNNNFQQYHSSSESSALENVTHRFTRAQPLDYDSQHRLNESGLPQVDSMTMQARKVSAPSSYLGVAGNHVLPSYTLGRSAQIRGRAMSQQSLNRPNMPSMAGRRRRPAGGSNSGSDVGGSSMSLVSRLNGRYENAHTRNPVVMYIPQVSQKDPLMANKSTLEANKSSTLRKSSRGRMKTSSHDRSKRSLSRNGSDSESSSMLRTLLRPKSRHQANNISKRRMHNMMLDRHDDDEEDLDRIGQLATELDSYKFRRRYSVPKDAKINWFAKLKQKVSSSGR